MTTENKEQNFFILLGLNPDASWDEAKFEQVLADKMSEWKRASTGIAARSREAQRNLGLVSQIRETMGDPALRAAHARAAKEELAAKRAARRERCDTQLNIAQSRGFLFEKELQDFIRDFSDAYSEREIRARVTVEIRRNAPEHSQEQPVDRIIAEDITRVLERLGIESLYQLLALPSETSTQELHKAAERLYGEMSRRRPETPEVKDKKELAGHAMAIFKAEESRRQYDENLRYRSLDALFNDLDPVVERVPGKTVYEPDIKLFLQKAALLGFSEETALERLQVHGMQRKWFLRSGSDPIDKNTRRQQNAEALRVLLEHKQLYRADEFLGRLKPGEIADRQRYQKEIVNGISKANELVKKALSPFTSHEEKIHHCRMALHLCADCKEAYGKLSALLTAPRSLQITVNNMGVVLSWEPLPMQDVSYKLIRKAGSQPESDRDGFHLVTTGEHVYQDTTLETGVATFYAVFTVCDEVVSIEGARLRQPMLLMAEVTNEEVRVDDQRVELSWQVPDNVYGVVVRRKEKIQPQSIQDGILLPLSGDEMTQVIDCCVRNNITYYYGIYCQFRDHEGSIVSSRGKIISVTPEEQPEVINFLNIERRKLAHGYEVQISWEGTGNGNRVLLLKSRKSIPFEQNKSILLSQLGQYGEVLPGEGNMRKDVWEQAGIRYYTSAIISRNMAYLGPSYPCVCGEDVSELKCQKVGTALRLDWKWPEHCQEVLIYYGHENYPRPQSHEAITNAYRVTREEYDYFGYFDKMNGTTGQNYYIVVAALIEHEWDHITTAGDRLHVYFPRRMVIEYEIKQHWFGRRKRFLHLMTRTPGRLPPWRLVGQRHRVPLNKSDGEEFFRWTEWIELVNEYSLPLPDTEVPPNTFVGLFLEDNAAYEFVDVLLPVKEKLRLR